MQRRGVVIITCGMLSLIFEEAIANTSLKGAYVLNLFHLVSSHKAVVWQGMGRETSIHLICNK